MSAQDHLSPGQFYHGTSALLGPDDVIEPDHPKVHESSRSGYVYATPHVDAAENFGRVANIGEGYHVYEVEPTGKIESDPEIRRSWLERDLRDSVRSRHPLRVVREIGPSK